MSNSKGSFLTRTLLINKTAYSVPGWCSCIEKFDGLIRNEVDGVKREVTMKAAYR